MKNNLKLVILCMLTLAVIMTIPSQGVVVQEYEDTPSHTKTVTITNTTQTDVAFDLFTVSKWGKMVSNFTWDGENGDDLQEKVNFWTIELTEAKQADYGDLGFLSLYSFTDFPKVDSHECKLYWVDDGELPITISYEIDTTKNPSHEIEPETTLTLVVKYFSLEGEEATKGKRSEAEYEDIPSHTKTVVITNTTQTDVTFELFTVSKWGKMISNFTWDGENGDDLQVRVNFWTSELTEANQADYGDLGFLSLYSFTDFPKVDSHECQLYWVDTDELPITIYYEIDKTKNPDHEIELGTTLTLEVKYYDFKGEKATEEAPAAGFMLTILPLIALVMLYQKRRTF